MVGQKGKHRLGSFSETLALNVLRVSCIEYRRELVRHAEERRGEEGREETVREKLFSLSTCAETRLFSFAIYAFTPLIV